MYQKFYFEREIWIFVRLLFSFLIIKMSIKNTFYEQHKEKLKEYTQNHNHSVNDKVKSKL